MTFLRIVAQSGLEPEARREVPTLHFFQIRAGLIACLLVLARQVCAQATTGSSASNEVRIVTLQGTAEIIRAGATVGVLTQTTNQPALNPGDQIRTSPKSRISLQSSDQCVVTLRANTVVEIKPPHVRGAQPGLHLFRGLMSYFGRDPPGRTRVTSPGADAFVKGTEFVVSVETVNNTALTTLYLVDGEVQFTNEHGALILTGREQAAFAESGKPPVPAPGFIVNNVLQWAFYYPAVLDLRDLPLTPQDEQFLGDSLAAYRAGDLLNALVQYPDGRQPGSEAERVYYAALLLSIGQVKPAEDVLAPLSAADPSTRLPRLANALRTLIAAVKRQERPSTLSPQLSTELLAASYYEQSLAVGDDSLKRALALARQAATNSLEFGFAWARAAELEFSFGHTSTATDDLNRSLTFSPSNAQALALKGFLLAARHKTGEAIDWFNRAMAVDSALGNAWLGRGLCRIRRGDSRGGREDLLVAAALEPQRAFLRSYLGKAYADSGDGKRASHELELAKYLDQADPTAWLYSALLNREENRLNEGVRDLEKSIDLNDNRALYRSRFLLDEDRAVRSSSLARIYQDTGMDEVAVREAARAVSYDYANYSAHQFISESFNALRDPTRFNLRYETPWFSELLLANLLSPVGGTPLSQNISQQEYSRFFERNRIGLSADSSYRSDGQYREIASQFGVIGNTGWSLDLDYQHNNGVRPNNELDRIEWYSTIKQQLTPQDSVLLLAKYQDYHSGDNFQYYDPLDPTNGFRPHFSFDESQKPILVGGYHHEWAPGIHTLALAGHLTSDQHISDQAVTLPVITVFTNGQVSSVRSTSSDVRYRNQLGVWIGEASQVLQGNRNVLIFGGRFQAGDFETRNTLTNRVFPGFFPTIDQTVKEDFQRASLYAYDTWEPVPHLWLTAGLSYDNVKFPENHRQVPISEGQAQADRLGPKAALVWSPSSVVTLRGAYSRSLGGVSLDESYRLEPSQLAGFVQTYRSIISESIVGSVSAPTFDTFGTALDLKFKTRTYIGLSGEILGSDVDRVLGVYRGTNVAFLGRPSSTPQRLNYDEYSASLVMNQLLSDEWALGASYKFTRSELDRVLPEADARRFDRADLHTVGFNVLYQHSCGFFGIAEAVWYWQQNSMSTNAPSGQTVHVPLPGDEFPQLNFWLGYRFPRDFGDVSIGLLNANDTDYRLNPLNPYVELPRERVVAARLRFRF